MQPRNARWLEEACFDQARPVRRFMLDGSVFMQHLQKEQDAMDSNPEKMYLYKLYNRLLYPEQLIGQYCGRAVVVIKEPTPDEYGVLLSLLSHKKARVRWMAACQLGKIRDERAVKPLAQALTDGHWMVRLHAAKALGRIGTSACFDPLVVTVKDGCHYVRRATMGVLKKANLEKAPWVVEALLDLLQNTDEGAQRDAIEYLSCTPTPAVIDALTEVALRDHDNKISSEVLNAFASIGSAAVVAVEKLLEHPNKETRFHAAIILGYCGHKRAIQYLESTLDDADSRLRERTESFLSQFRKRYPELVPHDSLWESRKQPVPAVSKSQTDVKPLFLVSPAKVRLSQIATCAVLPKSPEPPEETGVFTTDPRYISDVVIKREKPGFDTEKAYDAIKNGFLLGFFSLAPFSLMIIASVREIFNIESIKDIDFPMICLGLFFGPILLFQGVCGVMWAMNGIAELIWKRRWLSVAIRANARIVDKEETSTYETALDYEYGVSTSTYEFVLMKLADSNAKTVLDDRFARAVVSKRIYSAYTQHEIVPIYYSRHSPATFIIQGE